MLNLKAVELKIIVILKFNYHVLMVHGIFIRKLSIFNLQYYEKISKRERKQSVRTDKKGLLSSLLPHPSNSYPFLTPSTSQIPLD